MEQDQNLMKHIDMLGHEVEDVVTGFKGVVTTMSYDLYGCIQAIVTPKASKDGSYPQGTWFDVNRLKVTSKKRVMEIPFHNAYVAAGNQGCAVDKPLP